MSRLSLKGSALAFAALWSSWLLLVGLINRFWPEYGRTFLHLMQSIYPGYKASYGLVNLSLGVGYAFIDGLLGGLIFAWVYNRFSQCCKPKPDQTT